MHKYSRRNEPAHCKDFPKKAMNKWSAFKN